MNQKKQNLKFTDDDLYSDVSNILFKYDIMNINFEVNVNEYEPEAKTIIKRLSKDNNIGDVSLIVYEEFLKWFGKDCIPTKDSNVYTDIAKEILNSWIKNNK